MSLNLITERTAVSTALLLLGCALLAHTFTLGFSDLGGAFSPVFFPRIVLSAWIALAIISLIADILKNADSSSAQWRSVVILSIALLAYINLLQGLGFFISSAMFCSVVLIVTGQRRVPDIILYSVFIPGALVLLFNHILTMPLPVSPFFWWI